MAVGRKNIEDALRESEQRLRALRKELDEVGVQKSNIEKALADYRSKVQQLEKELKKP